MKKVHFLTHRCKGCGLCVLFCPTKVLRMSDTLNDQGHACPELVDFEGCTGCGLCFRMCPDLAIEIRDVQEPECTHQDEQG